MTTSALISAIVSAITSNTALSTWCTAQFSKSLSVFVGIDENDPPEASSYPLVCIVGVDQDRGVADRELRWEVTLGIGLTNTSVTTVSSVTTRAGLAQVETLRELIENAIYAADILPTGTSSKSSSECFHPLYVSYVTMSFRALNVVRNGPPG